MRYCIFGLIMIGMLVFASSATAQCVTTYYAPVPIVVGRPVYAAPVTSYYAPAPSVAHRPSTVVFRPVVPATVAPVPAVYGRPIYHFYSPYGGSEIRVPGQPILNTLRAIVP